MDFSAYQVNLILAWLWIVLGFIFGAILGLNFHKEGWLGGYASFKRRLYRLSHISFFGLALINLAFFFTVQGLSSVSPLLDLASWGFIIGAITMPISCILMAYYPATAIFTIPVVSLIGAGTFTLWEIIRI